MRVRNCLTGSLANVDPDVVAIRHAGRFDVTPYCRNKSPHVSLFCGRKGEKLSFVPTRNNEAVSVI
jgi:hypothetical protein